MISGDWLRILEKLPGTAAQLCGSNQLRGSPEVARTAVAPASAKLL